MGVPADEMLSEVTLHRVPTIDDEVPSSTYLDWRPEQTKIVTFGVGDTALPSMYQSESRAAARLACVEKFGRILEENYVPGKVFFRVMRG